MSVTTGFIQIFQVNQTQQIPQLQQILGSWRIPSSVVVWGSVVLSAKASSSSFFLGFAGLAVHLNLYNDGSITDNNNISGSLSSVKIIGYCTPMRARLASKMINSSSKRLLQAE